MTRSLQRARILVLVGAVVTGVLFPATGAAAHTRTQETTNLRSRITQDPGLPGVTWTVHTGGLLLEVTNDSDEVLVVEGYEGEPYLRLGPDGVEHNRRSPATYLNDERIGLRVSSRTGVAMPRDVDPSAPPEWIKVSDEPHALWHDHRVHWMSTQPPAFVEASPLARTLMRVNLVGVIGRAGEDAGVFHEWTVPFSLGGRPAVLAGEMAWEDPPSSLPYLLVAALLVAPALVGLRRRDPAAMLRPAALTVLLVATLNGIHLVDDLVAWPSAILDELFGLLHTTLFLGIGIAGSLWALKMDSGQRLALGVASGAVLYHQGFVHLPMLHASQFPTIWPQPLVRLTIAAGLLQALAIAVVVLRSRRLDREQTPPGSDLPVHEPAASS